jgi:predicted DNA-binding transcriptional regulator YafY
MTSLVVTIDYTNWRGQRRKRRVIPGQIMLGNTQWHPEWQWLLSAFDLEDQMTKQFAMKDIHGWEPHEPPPIAAEEKE